MLYTQFLCVRGRRNRTEVIDENVKIFKPYKTSWKFNREVETEEDTILAFVMSK